MFVEPSTEFEAVIDVGTTGLTGTIGLRINDNLGATVAAFDDTDIEEIADGVYAANTRTSPGTAGQYTLIWTEGAAGDVLGIEDLVVTTEDVSVTIGSGHLYVTRTELKAILKQAGETFQDLAIDIAVEAASRACDGYKRTRFYPTTETRKYTANVVAARRIRSYSERSFFLASSSNELAINDLVSASSVTVDTDGDGDYETTWVEGTDFVFEPANAALEGIPYRSLFLLPQVGKSFPQYKNAIKITGSFGWAAAPGNVKMAAVLMANRFLVKMTKAPLGILVVAANEMVTSAYLGGIDKDAAFLLDTIPGAQRPALQSLQLG